MKPDELLAHIDFEIEYYAAGGPFVRFTETSSVRLILIRYNQIMVRVKSLKSSDISLIGDEILNYDPAYYELSNRAVEFIKSLYPEFDFSQYHDIINKAHARFTTRLN